MKLYTFAVSHFSEKARWTLDLAGLDYEEVILLPGPHAVTIRRLARRTTVPVLADDGHVVQGSSRIIDHVEQRTGSRLTPADPEKARAAKEIEQLADRAFGLGSQRIFYEALLPDRRTVIDVWTQHGPWWGKAFYALSYPLLRRGVSRLYDIQPASVARSKELFFEAMDRTDRALAGQRYLAGDRLSRADVTVAALLAPLCRPAEHLIRWPEVPQALFGFTEALLGRPTCEHALRMYREHRGRPLDGRGNFGRFPLSAS